MGKKFHSIRLLVHNSVNTQLVSLEPKFRLKAKVNLEQTRDKEMKGVWHI
jgi:hypothetical protein